MLVPGVAVLIVAGAQVPSTPLGDVVLRVGGVLFWQSGPMGAKLGVTSAVIVILNVCGLAHSPAAGVNT